MERIHPTHNAHALSIKATFSLYQNLEMHNSLFLLRLLLLNYRSVKYTRNENGVEVFNVMSAL